MNCNLSLNRNIDSVDLSKGFINVSTERNGITLARDNSTNHTNYNLSKDTTKRSPLPGNCELINDQLPPQVPKNSCDKSSKTNNEGTLTPGRKSNTLPRTSPKNKSTRVTFDTSSVNSSPRSRSSREKDEESFRTNVAQSIGLPGGTVAKPSPKPCIKLHKETMEGFGKTNSSTDDLRLEVVPVDENVPGPVYPEILNPAKKQAKDATPRVIKPNARDGMDEYAADYKERSKPGPLAPKDSNPENLESDVSSRRELREPDGASGTSSPATLPSKDVTMDRPKDAVKQGSSYKDEVELDLEEKPEGNVVLQDDVNDIPSTNIAVACLVTLCFNLPFGILAIYYSLMATKAYRDGKAKQGAKKARISIYISLFSIVLTVLIVMAVVLVQAMKGQARQRRYTTKTSVSL